MVIPYLYSDVVITTDPETLREYVIQYSHADTIQVDAHNKVIIGATETKEWEDSEDTPDVDELERQVFMLTRLIPLFRYCRKLLKEKEKVIKVYSK